MLDKNSLPISDMEEFRQQILNANIPFEAKQASKNIIKLSKNLVIAYNADSTGCGHIRCIFPLTYLNALHGKSGKYNLIVSPTFIFQHDVLMKARTIFFQRAMSPSMIDAVRQYREMKSRYGYKMVYDIDDFVWNGPDEGECIPDYNFGSTKIKADAQQAAIEIMNMMDLVCVSTPFLGEYIRKRGVTAEIKVIHNTVPQYFWGNKKRSPIKEKIKKPRIVCVSSPTHYSNNPKNLLRGDFDCAWTDWIIKNVKDDKIDYVQFGGLPWFFKSIQHKIKIIDWVNSFQYHVPVINAKPDFIIGPLVPNYFNYSKSNIKATESYAAGAVFIGNTWKGTKYEKFPSPYDDCPVNIPYDISVDELDELFWSLTEPENFNKILKQQYDKMVTDGLYMESKKYIDLISSIV